MKHVRSRVLGLLLALLFIPAVAHAYSDCMTITIDQSGADYYNGAQCYGGHKHYSHFLPSEKCLRRQLYWLYAYNPHYLELNQFPIDYFTTIVAEHIKLLKSKIMLKQNGLRSNAMLRGVVLSVFSALWGSVAYDTYKKRACSIKPEEAVVSAVIIGSVSALLAAIAGTQFDRVYRHAERLVERLERDKRIIAALERIKAAQGRDKV